MILEKIINAKPFSRDFDEQLDAVNSLYGYCLKFHFPAQDIDKQVDEILERYQMMAGHDYGYSAAEIDRVKEALRFRARKYEYMFCE